MGWPCSRSSIAALIRFGFGVWATDEAAPRNRHAHADTQISVLPRFFMVSSPSSHVSESRLNVAAATGIFLPSGGVVYTRTASAAARFFLLERSQAGSVVSKI